MLLCKSLAANVARICPFASMDDEMRDQMSPLAKTALAHTAMNRSLISMNEHMPVEVSNSCKALAAFLAFRSRLASLVMGLLPLPLRTRGGSAFEEGRVAVRLPQFVRVLSAFRYSIDARFVHCRSYDRHVEV